MIYSRQPINLGEALREQGRSQVSIGSALGIPAEHAGAELADFDLPTYEDERGNSSFPLADHLAAWDRAGSPALLWLVGPQGAGKTRAAWALALAAAARGESVLQVVTSTFIVATRALGEAAITRPAARVDLLVLDDLGRTPLNARDFAVLTDLLTTRCGRTVFTSNMWPAADADLGSAPDEAFPFWSRIRTATVLPVFGPDLRTSPESSI